MISIGDLLHVLYIRLIGIVNPYRSREELPVKSQKFL